MPTLRHLGTAIPRCLFDFMLIYVLFPIGTSSIS